MLELKEDIEVWDIINEAVNLLNHVIATHSITSFEEFTCSFMKALAKQLYYEIE